VNTRLAGRSWYYYETVRRITRVSRPTDNNRSPPAGSVLFSAIKSLPDRVPSYVSDTFSSTYFASMSAVRSIWIQRYVYEKVRRPNEYAARKRLSYLLSSTSIALPFNGSTPAVLFRFWLRHGRIRRPPNSFSGRRRYGKSTTNVSLSVIYRRDEDTGNPLFSYATCKCLARRGAIGKNDLSAIFGVRINQTPGNRRRLHRRLASVEIRRTTAPA